MEAHWFVYHGPTKVFTVGLASLHNLRVFFNIKFSFSFLLGTMKVDPAQYFHGVPTSLKFNNVHECLNLPFSTTL